jgi:hypothetical protein
MSEENKQDVVGTKDRWAFPPPQPLLVKEGIKRRGRIFEGRKSFVGNRVNCHIKAYNNRRILN